MYTLSRTLVRQKHLGGLARRQCHHQSGGGGGGGGSTDWARTYFNKVLDNPLPLGAGALVVGLLQLKRIRDREASKVSEGQGQEICEAAPWQVSCYSNLPLRHISR